VGYRADARVPLVTLIRVTTPDQPLATPAPDTLTRDGDRLTITLPAMAPLIWHLRADGWHPAAFPG